MYVTQSIDSSGCNHAANVSPLRRRDHSAFRFSALRRCSCFRATEEPLAKLGAKNACVDQPVVVMFATEWRCGRRPLARFLQRRTAAGHDCVNVNVSVQLLIPCVQHHRGGGFVMLFGFQNRLQRTPRRAKQQG